ncbi:hypothetical protein ABZ354_25220 [Streptomyces sp. NPDC005925]|uniref:hypothetical protein n=1 Tax=Streptomyces sp. NPDC005925 TaxID=3157172 RepID=UPI0033F47D05
MSNDQPNGHPHPPAPHPQYLQPGPQPGRPGPYAQHPQYGGYVPPSGAAPYANAPHAPYAPAAPHAMPGPVRAARVVVFVMAGLAVVLTALVTGTSDSVAGGRFFGMFLMTVPLFVLAFRYATAGNGVRVASIVLASVQLALALGAAGRGTGGWVVPAAGAITLLVLLAQASSRAWFRRNSDGVPPQAPYGPYGA